MTLPLKERFTHKISLTKKYKAIDLFAEIGGIRLGFANAFKDNIEFVFLENVKSFVNHDGNTFRVVKETLEDMNYKVND